MEETNANDSNEDDNYTNDTWSRTSYTYDKLNRLIDKRVYDQDNKLLGRESHVYSDVYTFMGDTMHYSLDCQTIWGDGSNIITNTLRDKYGRVVKVQMMQSVATARFFDTYTYNYLGQKLTLKTALDYKNNPTLPYSSKWEYDFAGRVLKEYNAEGHYIATAYDWLGRKLSVTDYMGSVSTITYDKLGRTLTETVPFETVNSVAVNKLTKYYYDRNGNIIKQMTSNNDLVTTPYSFATTEYAYNSRNMLTGVTNYEDTTPAMQVAYTYDASGNQLTKVVNPNAVSPLVPQTTTMTYDRFGNIHTLQYPLSTGTNQTEHYTYDINGKLTAVTDRDGNVTTTTYDGLGRVLSTSVTDGTTTQTKSTAYTLDGQTKTLTENGITYAYTYDNTGRKTQQTETGGITKDYTYNVGGQLVSESLTVGTTTTTTSYEYDIMGRVWKVYNGSIATGTLTATYAYDDNGNRESLVYSNGNSTLYTYNLANMVKVIDNRNSGTTVSKFTYAYRLDGNQIAKTDDIENNVTTYVYDDLGRLTEEELTEYAPDPDTVLTTSYTYDKYGNRATKTTGTVTTTYAYDLNNRLTTEVANSITTAYTYDESGNQLTKTVGAGTPEENDYDLFGRLTNADGAVYTYGPDDLRRNKTVNSVTTQFVWNGQNMVAELVSGAVQTRYLYGINLICSIAGTTTKYYLYNAHGDVVQLASSTGAVIKTYRYDAFGIEIVADVALYGDVDASGHVDNTDVNMVLSYSAGLITAFPCSYGFTAADVNGDNDINIVDVMLVTRYVSGLITHFSAVDANADGVINENGTVTNTTVDTNPFRYCGEYFDKETSTYYLRARYYDPEIGRFISQDGMEYIDDKDPLSLNLYTYCSGNPVMYVDPTGNFAWPGELHRAVQSHIVYGSPYGENLYNFKDSRITMGFDPSPCGRYFKTEAKINYSKKAQDYMGTKSGRADLVDRNTGEYWEIKSNYSGTGLAQAQYDVEGYSMVDNAYNSKELRGFKPTAGATTFGSSFTYRTNMFEYYSVTYYSPEPGIILYNYTKHASMEEAEAAEAAFFILLLLLGIACPAGSGVPVPS